MRHLLCCLCLLLLGGLVHADYPTPQAAGFHHCALIYDAAQRGVPELLPYVADERGWLFDSFLFLHQQTRQGLSFQDGRTRMADWQAQLDTWFAPGRDLAALDEALDQCSKRLGAPPPRPIMLSLPHPDAALKDFGDVDGDGVTEDLSTPHGQETVARWYLNEARKLFAGAHFRHLTFWGLYWMNEGIPDRDAATVALCGRVLHEAGLRFLWIPYYRADGWQRWRDLGFDVAIMQPNYAFLDTHGGTVRRNRLAVTATEAREHGLGVEIELPMSLSIPGSPRLFREYLRDGAAERYGYQQAATAYYLGSQCVEKLAAARDPLYAGLASYVHGDTVSEPDLAVQWRVGGQPAPWLSDQHLTPGRPLTAAEGTLAEQPLEALDVFLYEPGKPWTGLITVEGQAGVGKPWQAVGWALRAGQKADDGRYQVTTVPLTGSWHALRVTFKGEGVPLVAELTPQPPTLGKQGAHLAYRCRYQVSSPDPARYGDTGYELTDGVIPDQGFSSGKTVGWSHVPVAVTVDLGEAMPVEGAELHLQYDETAAVLWPHSTLLTLASDSPPPGHPDGLGAPPGGFSWVAPGEPVIDRKRTETDYDAHVPFTPARPVTARYVTFLAEAHVWLMLSEICVFSGGRNVVAGRPYTLQPSPTPIRGFSSYPDDGLLLTDGIVAQSFSLNGVYGWSDGKPRTIDVDLGRSCLVDQVTAWSLTGARAAIFPPASIGFSLSEDGRAWQEAGMGTPAPAPAEPSTACPFTLKLGGRQARYVRVVVTPSQGWSMVSEIEVAGQPR